MKLSTEEIARAFSSHRFEVALPYLLDDVVWEVVGGEDLSGKRAVTNACTALGEELTDVETTFDRIRAVVAAECVVIDSIARYLARDGSLSTVASCDIYDFAEGLITRIRSYNVELQPV
jgi:ketosteroid isomerase-like protein